MTRREQRPIAANLLKGEADKDTGGNYALSGNVLSSITSVTADSTGNLTVLTKAQGVWVYQFDATAKTTLAKLIVGKTQNDATTILLQQAGVSKVDGISIPNGGIRSQRTLTRSLLSCNQ